MQGSKLYVGNFSLATTKEDLVALFSQQGEVVNATVIEGRGFGFVEMGSPADAEKAKTALDGSELAGQQIKVDEARPPRDKRLSGGGGGGGGFRGGREGGYRGGRDGGHGGGRDGGYRQRY